MSHSFKISVLFCLLLGTGMYAQDDSGLDTEDITVVKDYEARIADAQKINVNPGISAVELPKQELSYAIPNRLLELNYPPHTIKPYSMPRVKPRLYNHSFIKLGFGTQYSPLAEIVYINKEAENLEFGASFKHLSAYGQKIENQRFRDNSVGLFAKYDLKKVQIAASFDFTQDVDYFYGYNQVDTGFKRSSIKHRVREMGGDISIQNSLLEKNNFDHKQVVSTSFANDNFKVNEWYLNYKADFTKVNKNKHFFNINADFDVSNYT
ncbi:MAG: hypothetical protein ISR01_03490, partial [Chitinophagales bacterium]|nr:hypothetical protein [Chitinophagales bacterium]